ncbi:24027_t:CDS:2, partial [Gigaspora rosea]
MVHHWHNQQGIIHLTSYIPEIRQIRNLETPEQKNDSNLEAENDNEEQQNVSNLEAENDNQEQLNDPEEEKGSLTDENIKVTDVSEDENQSKKRKTSVSEEED